MPLASGTLLHSLPGSGIIIAVTVNLINAVAVVMFSPLVLAACSTLKPTVILSSTTQTVTELLAAHPPDPNRDITALLLRKGKLSSQHLVYVRGRERPHLHKTHDLTVTLLAGKGDLWVGGGKIPMRPGDVAVVGAGEIHFFVSEGSRPAAALASFSPPFAGQDRVFVQRRERPDL